MKAPDRGTSIDLSRVNGIEKTPNRGSRFDLGPAFQEENYENDCRNQRED